MRSPRPHPAAVCPGGWLDDHTLQAIAAENNLRNGFPRSERDDSPIRWFTPLVEVSCAAMRPASAYVARSWACQALIGLPQQAERVPSGGARRGSDDGLPIVPRRSTIRHKPGRRGSPNAFTSEEGDLLVVLASEEVRAVSLTWARSCLALSRPHRYGPGDDCDFVSRFFAPAVRGAGDPVTGSAHCVLAPTGGALWRRSCWHAKSPAAAVS